MKIRSGFVSNSSSSSFVLVVKEDSFKEAYNKLTDIEKQIIDVVYSSRTVLGQPCKVFGSYYGMDGEGYPSSEDTWYELELEDDVDPMEVVDHFNTGLEKLGKDVVFTDHQGNG